MKKRERFNSFYVLLVLLVLSGVIYLLINYFPISADKGESFYKSIPLKKGDNLYTATRPIDLSSRIIGINGSLLTLNEAQRRGIIAGVFDTEGNEFDKLDLLVSNASFIIKVEGIDASPSLFLEGIK